MLAKKWPDVFYTESMIDVSEADLMTMDVVVVQRGLFGDAQVGQFQSMIQRLKLSGKKLIYEVDDDLDNLPVSNSATAVMTPEVRAFVAWLRAEADAIFVTTESLKRIVGYPEKTYVLPNAIDASAIEHPARTEDRDSFVHVVWAGGATHDVDFDWFGKTFNDMIVNKRPQWEDKLGKRIIFGFLTGRPPEQVHKFFETTLVGLTKRDFIDPKKPPAVVNGGRVVGPDFYIDRDPDIKDGVVYKFILKGRNGVRLYPAINVRSFHQHYVNLMPDVALCPLNPAIGFNLGKSNIKFVEGTIAGAACVVSNTGPFRDIPETCAKKAKTPEQFVQGVRELIFDAEVRRQMREEAMRYVEDNFSLDRVAVNWARTFCEIAGKDQSFLC
jgi:glycosyltransferase involved in cell wall biosynthesis